MNVLDLIYIYISCEFNGYKRCNSDRLEEGDMQRLSDLGVVYLYFRTSDVLDESSFGFWFDRCVLYFDL